MRPEDLRNNLLEFGSYKLRTLFQVVEVGDLGLMMFAVVIFESFLGDMRLQCVQCIGERGELMLHLLVS